MQTSIDFSPPPHVRGSTTSRAAAIGIEPKAGTKRALLLQYLRSCLAQGATDEEMQQRVPMSPNTQRPRRVELLEAQLIKDSGMTRKTIGGHDAVVWVAVLGDAE